MTSIDLVTPGYWSRTATTFLLFLFLSACGGGERSAQATVSQTDTVLNAILESAAQERPTSPRLPDGQQAQGPISIAEMGYNYGSPSAPVKVLEISDFGCGVCRRFHLETFPALLSTYVDKGFVEWKFIPYVLGRFPNALEAALAAECAGEQDKFVQVHSPLFRDQAGWRNADDPNAFFSTLAGQEGLDVERFDRCIEEGWREERIGQNNRLGQQIGAYGTPLFLVDGRQIPGALPLAEFRTILDASLVRRGVTPPGGG